MVVPYFLPDAYAGDDGVESLSDFQSDTDSQCALLGSTSSSLSTTAVAQQCFLRRGGTLELFILYYLYHLIDQARRSELIPSLDTCEGAFSHNRLSQQLASVSCPTNLLISTPCGQVSRWVGLGVVVVRCGACCVVRVAVVPVLLLLLWWWCVLWCVKLLWVRLLGSPAASAGRSFNADHHAIPSNEPTSPAVGGAAMMTAAGDTTTSAPKVVVQSALPAVPPAVDNDVKRGPNQDDQPSVKPTFSPPPYYQCLPPNALHVVYDRGATEVSRMSNVALLTVMGFPDSTCEAIAGLALSDWKLCSHGLDAAIAWSTTLHPPKLTEYIDAVGLRGRAKKVAFFVAMALRKGKTVDDARTRALGLLQLTGPDGQKYKYSIPSGGDTHGAPSDSSNLKRTSPHLLPGDSASSANKRARTSVV
jgi:hypothetical protein